MLRGGPGSRRRGGVSSGQTRSFLWSLTEEEASESAQGVNRAGNA